MLPVKSMKADWKPATKPILTEPEKKEQSLLLYVIIAFAHPSTKSR